MPWQAIIPLIQAGINMASNAQANNTNYNLSKEQFQRQEEFAHNEAILADQRQRAQYNDLYSVQAQADQIRKAGMSLSTLYGIGGIGGSANGNMANSPNQTPIPMQPSKLDGIGHEMAEMELLNAQKENIEADTENKKSQTRNNDKLNEVYDTQIDNIKANTRLTDAQKETEIQRCHEVKTNIEKLNTEINNLELTGKEIEARTNYYNAESALLDAQKQTEDLLRKDKRREINAHITQMYASARQMNADATLTEKTTEAQVQLICMQASKEKLKQDEGIWNAEIEMAYNELTQSDYTTALMRKDAAEANAIYDKWKGKWNTKLGVDRTLEVGSTITEAISDIAWGVMAGSMVSSNVREAKALGKSAKNVQKGIETKNTTHGKMNVNYSTFEKAPQYHGPYKVNHMLIKTGH